MRSRLGFDVHAIRDDHTSLLEMDEPLLQLAVDLPQKSVCFTTKHFHDSLAIDVEGAGEAEEHTQNID